MNFGKGLKGLLLGVPLLLAGCAGFWQDPDSSSTDGVGTSTLSSGVFFVLNQAQAQIASYYISTGTLKSPSASPVALSSTPYSMAVSPNGSFLYVSTTAGIYAYSIGTNGALTILNDGSVISTDASAYALAVDKSGAWLLDASGSGYLYAIPISSSTGKNTSTTPQQIALPGAATQQIALSPDGKFLFVTCGSGGSAAIAFTAANANPFGASKTITVNGASGSAIAVAVDPLTSPRLFYIGETAVSSSTSNTGGIRVFDYASLRDSSTISELSASPYASAGLAPYALQPKSDGTYLYVANRTVSGSSNGNIVGFTVSGSSGSFALTQLGSSLTVTAGYYPVSLAIDSYNNFLLVANFGKGTTAGGNPDLAGYNFDSSTAGKLDYVISSTTGTDPTGAVQVLAIR